MKRAVGGVTCLVLAVALGAGSNWFTGPPLLFTIASMQAVWAAGACLAGAVIGGRRPRRGALAGGVFGLLAIGSYYAASWHTYGAAITSHRLIQSGGEFWVSAAVVGGALMGANGVVFTRWPTGRVLDPSALAHAALAGVFACEAMFVLLQIDRFVYWQHLRAVSIGLLACAALLGLRTLARSGWRATTIAFVIAAASAPLAAGIFFVIEHRYGYVTV